MIWNELMESKTETNLKRNESGFHRKEFLVPIFKMEDISGLNLSRKLGLPRIRIGAYKLYSTPVSALNSKVKVTNFS